MAESPIEIPEGFEPVLENDISIPEGFELVEPSFLDKGIEAVDQVAGLGSAFLQGRTFGLAPKLAAGIGAAEAKILLEGGEQAIGLANKLGITDKTYTSPSLGDLYKKGVQGFQENVKESYEEHPYLTAGAEMAGGLKTAMKMGGTRVGQGITNWAAGASAAGKPLSKRAASLFSKTIKQGALGAAGYAAYEQGVADPTKQGEGIVGDLITGGITAGGLGLAGSGLGAGVRVLTPMADEALMPVVELAKKYNIPVSLNQITDSRAMKNVQKVSQELPFSGHSKFKDKQISSFQRALSKTFGQDSDKITPELMDTAFTKLGKEFDSFAGNKTFSGQSLRTNIDTFLEDAEEVYSADAFNAAKNRIKKIAEDFDADGMLSGKKLSFHRAKVNQLARKANDIDKQSIFRDIENALIETASEGDEAIKSAFSKTKQQYKNLIAIEPLAVKAKGGQIKPALLNNRVSRVYGRQHTRGKSGELGELARIGNELLPELGGSDTAQKLLTAGAVASPLVAPVGSLGVGGALAANKGFQKWFNQNPKIVENALMKAYQGSAKRIPQKSKVFIEKAK